MSRHLVLAVCVLSLVSLLIPDLALSETVSGRQSTQSTITTSTAQPYHNHHGDHGDHWGRRWGGCW